MRWDGLFADLEGQLAAEERRELDSEVAERTRRERALVDTAGRLAAAREELILTLDGGTCAAGTVADLGTDWVLLRAGEGAVAGREVLVPLAGVLSIEALGGQSAQARTARRFGLGYALRALSRDRATVAVTLRGGSSVIGTIDTVGADHFDLAEHHEGELRRRENVRRTLTLPFAALVSIESRR